jgi:aryl-alcohol dehydrogenase-like predicted oxidoreductase
LPGSTEGPARAGHSVHRIGFGTWVYGPADTGERLAALREARALGCTFFDTSNLYGWGEAETLLARAFGDARGSVKIATKAGYVTPGGQQDFAPDAVRRSLDASLARLQTEYVDLLQLHNPAPDQVSDALVTALRREERIRTWGISARTPDEALLLVRRFTPDAVQVNFNLGDLRARRSGLFDACRRRGIAVIARTPLAAGFLTGALGDGAFADEDHRNRFDADTRARWVAAVERLRPVFDDVPEATPAQNALRFCLSFEAVTHVIPGMTHVAHVRENLAAARLPRLSPSQLRVIEATYDDLFR